MARRRAGEGRLPEGGEAGELLATPPSRFTAERDSLARGLAERGDAAGAAALRKLRRPVGLAWVLNRVARERRAELEALLGAGERLRAGQRRALAGQGADALREAEQELRAAARALRGRAAEVLAREGRPASPSALARIELLLRVAATAPGDAGADLRAGTLSREPEVGAGDLSGLGLVAGGTPAAAAEPSPRPRAASPAAAPPGRAPRTAHSAAAAGEEARRAERAERARAEREARQRARALAAARRRLEQAERAARAARRAADAALRRADSARARAEASESAAAARRAELEALERQ